MKNRAVISIVITVMLMAGLAAVGCGGRGPSGSAYEGAGVGAAVGGVAGALIDDDNRWRGGVIGGALGAALGGAMGEISNRAAKEASTYQKPVYYQNQAGQRVEAYPQGNRGNCHVVKEKYYDRGQLVKVVERTVCD